MNEILKSWNGDVWEDPDEAGDTEPLNYDAPSLSEEAASPLPSKGIKPALPEEIIVASLRKLPCKTMLSGLRTHRYHPSLL